MFSVRFSVFWPAVNSAAPRTPHPRAHLSARTGHRKWPRHRTAPTCPVPPPKIPSPPQHCVGNGWGGDSGRAGAAQPAAEELGGIPATAVGPRRRGRSRAAPCGAHSRTGGPCAAVTGGCVTGDSQQVDAWWLSRVKAPLPCGATTFECHQHQLHQELTRSI